jgi:outer membrane protein TolC
MLKTSILTALVAGVLTVAPTFSYASEDPSKIRLVLGVEDCVRIALKTAPELGESQANIELAASKLDEAAAHRYPMIEVTSLFGPAPQAHRENIFPVINTDKKYARLNQLTWFASTDAMVIQPLYTFGKISENMRAARHGVEVERYRKMQRANEVALKVREYYYGLLLAREMKELVLEVQEVLANARVKAVKLIQQGSDSADEVDLYKLDAFAGEVAKNLEEARKGENLAFAALKARLGLSGNTQLEIKSERLVFDGGVIPPYESFVDQARSRRPEFKQISEGLKARAALIEAARANYYPDIFLGGMISWAYADERDRINNPYISDRFNHFNGGIALGLRWKMDFAITAARVAAENAQYNHLVSTKAYADATIPLQVQRYYLDLLEAENSVVATKSAYSNAKKWGMAAMANFDFGVAPAKEIFDALQSYARMRAAYFQSIYNYRIARANLDFSTGELPVPSDK